MKFRIHFIVACFLTILWSCQNSANNNERTINQENTDPKSQIKEAEEPTTETEEEISYQPKESRLPRIIPNTTNLNLDTAGIHKFNNQDAKELIFNMNVLIAKIEKALTSNNTSKALSHMNALIEYEKSHIIKESVLNENDLKIFEEHFAKLTNKSVALGEQLNKPDQ